MRVDRERIAVIVPILLTIVLGAIAIWITGPQNTAFVDSDDYLAAAKMIFEKGAYPNVGGLPFFRPPLYPFFIAGVWMVFPGSILAIKVVQLLLNGLTCLFVYKTALQLTGDRRTSWLAELLFAVNPFFVLLQATIQSETLHTLLIVLSLYIIAGIATAKRIELKWAAVLGAVFGSAALCKPSAWGVGLVMAVTLSVLAFRRARGLLIAPTVVLVMFLTVLPWALYNLETKGEIILLDDGGGYALWLGNQPETLDLYERNFDSPEQQQAFADEIGKGKAGRQIEEWNRTVGYDSLTYSEREKLWSAKAIETITADPWRAARIFAWKFFNFWKPYVNANMHSSVGMVLTAVFVSALYVFGFWGLLKTWGYERIRPVKWLFLVLTFCVTAIHVVIVSQIRLRLPYVDPFLTIFAAIGMMRPLTRILNKLGWEILPGVSALSEQKADVATSIL